MTAAVVVEHRFYRDAQGRVWTNGPFAYSFWRRYLDVFDGVRAVARAAQVDAPPAAAVRADGPGVVFAPAPYYVGPWQYFRKLPRIAAAVRAAAGPAGAVILRVPSQLAACLDPWLRKTGRPFAVEAVGDPRDALAPGAAQHALRPLFRWQCERMMRRQCRRAWAACYVTQSALQARYPPAPGAFSIGCSDVELPPEAFAARPRGACWRRPLRLILAGSLEHLYKAPDVLIEAFAQCRRAGLDATLALAGDGAHRPALEQLARAAGVRERVEFSGQLPAGPAVRSALDEADLFVLPSRQEGLPRALLEAMARGLPAIGSTVGGFGELLPPEDLVPPGDASALAAKIKEVAADPLRAAAMSRRNLSKAGEYSDELLAGRRRAFYKQVRELAKAWACGPWPAARRQAASRPFQPARTQDAAS